MIVFLPDVVLVYNKKTIFGGNAEKTWFYSKYYGKKGLILCKITSIIQLHFLDKFELWEVMGYGKNCWGFYFMAT